LESAVFSVISVVIRLRHVHDILAAQRVLILGKHMRTWLIQEPGGERGEIYQVREVTDAEILEERWDWWKEIMEKKYGPGSPLITEENCIQDWVVDNYAMEYKDGDI
jgi:hypothetical protein